jgi:hypothetical protein
MKTIGTSCDKNENVGQKFKTSNPMGFLVFNPKKKKMIFHARGKHHKMFSAENIFRKNDFPKNIFQRKLFYVEVNGA